MSVVNVNVEIVPALMVHIGSHSFLLPIHTAEQLVAELQNKLIELAHGQHAEAIPETEIVPISTQRSGGEVWDQGN